MPRAGTHFPVPTAVLERVAHSVLDAARKGGATAAETEVSQAVGQSVTVRKGEVETIAYNRDKGIGITVYVGMRRGHASSADFSDESIRATVDKALAIARYTAEDPAAGLADPTRLAQAWPDLDLYHPWELPVERAIELGARSGGGRASRRCTHHEQRRRDRLAQASRSSSMPTARGFRAAIAARATTSIARSSPRPTTRCSAITGTPRRAQPRTCSRPRKSGASRASARCAGSGRASSATMECPVLFEAPEAADLIGSFVHAVSGGSLYRKIVVPARCARHAGIRAGGEHPGGAASSARARQRALRQRRRRDLLPRRRRRRRAARLLPGQLFGAQARHAEHGECRRRAQSRRPGEATTWRHCFAAWVAGCSSPSSSARASTR